MVWINARISEKSTNFWNRNLNLKNEVIKNIDHVFAQDKLTYQRFKKLGLSSSKLTQTENLKKFRTLPKVERKLYNRNQQIFCIRKYNLHCFISSR